MILTLDQPIESLPPIPSVETEEIMQAIESINEADCEELQILKQLVLTGSLDCEVNIE